VKYLVYFFFSIRELCFCLWIPAVFFTGELGNMGDLYTMVMSNTCHGSCG